MSDAATNPPGAGGPDTVDVLLERFLRERGDRDAEALFARLLERDANGIRSYLLRLGVTGDDLEDRMQEVKGNLWRSLNARRQTGDLSLHHFLAYAKTIARNLHTDLTLRKNRPAFSTLRRKINLLLAPENNVSPFARWEGAKGEWSGFKIWREGRLAKCFQMNPAYCELHAGSTVRLHAYWEEPTAGTEYKAHLDPEGHRPDRCSVVITDNPARAAGRSARKHVPFGNVLQGFNASPYRGKKVR